MEDLEKDLLAVLVRGLDHFTSEELAAFNVAACLYGRVADGTLAYAKALECALIKPDGSIQAFTEMKRALAHVIKGRMEAGTFV